MEKEKFSNSFKLNSPLPVSFDNFERNELKYFLEESISNGFMDWTTYNGLRVVVVMAL